MKSYRAEATDVANVVLDGADGILLGAETLRGRFPVLTVDTIMKICRQAEKVFDHVNHFDHLMQARPRLALSQPLTCLAAAGLGACGCMAAARPIGQASCL